MWIFAMGTHDEIALDANGDREGIRLAFLPTTEGFVIPLLRCQLLSNGGDLAIGWRFITRVDSFQSTSPSSPLGRTSLAPTY